MTHSQKLPKVLAPWLVVLALSGAVLARPASKTQASDVTTQITDYLSQIQDLSNKMADNQTNIAVLKQDVAARKVHTASQLRSAQLADQDYGNVVYQVLFNGKSLNQALAMATIVNQSTANIKNLSDEENQLQQDQVAMQKQKDDIQKIYNDLNTKYASQMQSRVSDRVAANAQIPATPGPGGQMPDDGSLLAYAANKMATITGTNASDWARIITRESGGNPAAVNASTGAYGLFQLMPMHAGVYPGMSVDEQIAVAVRLYQAGGWSPWALTY